MRSIIQLFIPLILVFCLSTANASAEVKFNDLTQNHWAYNQIMQLAKDGIVVGYPDGSYQPNEEITRAEFASMTVKALNQDAAEITDTLDFDDVPDTYWAWDSIQRAVRFDLISQTQNNKFRPDDNVTRAECLEVVINSLTTQDISLEEAQQILESKYLDANTIPEVLVIKTGKAAALGVIVHVPGEEAKIFANRPATRAEVAVFLYNMIEQVRLAPNKKLAEVMQPITAEGTVLENAIVRGTMGIIPPGTIIPVAIQNDLNSQTSQEKDSFSAKIADNLITPDKYLLMKKDAKLDGILIGKKKALIIIRNGKLVLNSKEVTTVDGQTAVFHGINETNPDLTIWRKIFKGLKVKYCEGEIIPLKVLKPVKIDLTNTKIIE